MDCPSRERAGWLCDSYFTAKTEYVLTGTNCAWMAIHVLRKKYDKSSEKYKALYNMQYKKIKKNGREYWVVKTIVPNAGFKQLSKLYGVSIQSVVE